MDHEELQKAPIHELVTIAAQHSYKAYTLAHLNDQEHSQKHYNNVLVIIKLIENSLAEMTNEMSELKELTIVAIAENLANIDNNTKSSKTYQNIPPLQYSDPRWN